MNGVTSAVPRESVLPANAEPLLLDKVAAARALAISVRTLDSLRTSGKIRARKVGQLVRFSPEDLRAYVNSLASEVTP